MTRKATPTRIILTYLALTSVLSSFFYAIVIYTGNLRGGGNSMPYATDLQWSVAVAALLTYWLLGENLGDLGWRWGEARYMAAAYFMPLFYAAIAYGGVWISGLGHFYNRQFVAGLATTYSLGKLSPTMLIATQVFFSMTGALIAALARALGEEIGWRGLLVPQLSKRFNFTTTALICGCIHAAWHFPVLLFSNYNEGTPGWYALTCFSVLVISFTFVINWLRLKSGSVWAAALLHASHNVWIQQIFTPLTASTGKTAYFIDEFGAALPIVTTIFAIYFWTRRKEVELLTT
jgi:membrane protease YdiL (CAAX protease family)